MRGELMRMPESVGHFVFQPEEQNMERASQ